MTSPPPASPAAFDDHDPPSRALLDDCVHCGFCLPACPTYVLWGQEMDSPRGRIALMDLAVDGEIRLDDDVVGHFDACLGCMACVTACPSGVQYGSLIEATRAQVERRHRRPLGERLFRAALFALFPHRGRLRVAATLGWLPHRLGLVALARRSGLLDRLPVRLRALVALQPDTAPALRGHRLPARTPARELTRARVGLLTGCVQDVYFAHVNAATARVLAAEGCEVVVPATQGCCGALELHAGRVDAARERARTTVAAFEAAGVDHVVVNAAGCGSSMKEYADLLADDPVWADRARACAERVRDVSELLDELGSRAPRHPIRARIAYHDACHLAHGQGIRAAPRRQLSAIDGLDLVELGEPDLCCGSAGIYNLTEPEPAAELGARKAAHVHAAGVDALATANPGCLLQLRRHLAATGDADVVLLHPIELVDAAIRGVDPLAARR